MPEAPRVLHKTYSFTSLMDKFFKQALRFQPFSQTLLGQSSQSKPMPRPAHSSALLTPSGHKPGTANQKSPFKPPKTAYFTESLGLQSLASYLKSGEKNYTARLEMFLYRKVSIQATEKLFEAASDVNSFG